MIEEGVSYSQNGWRVYFKELHGSWNPFISNLEVIGRCGDDCDAVGEICWNN
jgi:hypothetical protein